ncbi:hypothetical protein [Nitrosomonas sp. ANs5]|uniref:hypothetical protein n=1 Tax=Nitrosomonas sp. ANs5 TaxID=3423941 RepID=UPI003D33221C
MSKDIFGYALYTMQTGHRPISSFVDVFQHLAKSLVSQFDAIEKESGTTRREGLQIALSDTAILMAYSLVEGFFSEEYQFYFEKEPPRRQTLEDTIQELLNHIGASTDEQVNKGKSLLPVLRASRNAIAHRNGRLKETEKSKIQMYFGSRMCIRRGYPVANIALIFEILDTASKLISGFSYAAVDAATAAQQSAQADGTASGGPSA